MAGIILIGVLAAGALLADDVSTPAEQPTLPLSAARAIALNAVPGGEILEHELENDDGRLAYEFEIMAPRGLFEVEVDAITGRIIEVESEEE